MKEKNDDERGKKKGIVDGRIKVKEFKKGKVEKKERMEGRKT